MESRGVAAGVLCAGVCGGGVGFCAFVAASPIPLPLTFPWPYLVGWLVPVGAWQGSQVGGHFPGVVEYARDNFGRSE